ncbi:MAG: glucose-phosphatase [Bacteroidota bacterium]|nr:glucose-phosphatase [Bacteroidota bacterium]
MINTIIFDFGDIFINLDKEAPEMRLKKLGLKAWNADLDSLNHQFEVGKITKEAFLTGIQNQCEKGSLEEIQEAWNAILLDLPPYRLEFLQKLSQKYDLYLLSNTDSIHISEFERKSGADFYQKFYNCFKKVYFSYEIGMRKPNVEIYQHVLDNHGLDAKNTLFVDDKKENTDAAQTIGLTVWNLQVGQEDVVDLFSKDLI